MAVLVGLVLLAGCTLGDATADPAVSVAAATGAAAGSQWIITAGGDTGENHAGTLDGYGDNFSVPQPPRPNFSVPEAVGVVPTYTARQATCGANGHPRRIVPGATAGTGAATVSWQADQSADVSGYRVSAVSQVDVPGSQPTPVQKVVAQPAGCGQVSVTLTGLTSGVPYVFWLEEKTTSNVPTTVTRWAQVGTSSPTVIG